MPSSIVQAYLDELRSLPVPWIVQVSEQAAWSVEESDENTDQPDSEPRQAAMEFQAILYALEQEVAALKGLTPAIRDALRQIAPKGAREPSIAFSFAPGAAPISTENPDPIGSLRARTFVSLSEERIRVENHLLDNLLSELRSDIEERLGNLPNSGPPNPGRGPGPGGLRP